MGGKKLKITRDFFTNYVYLESRIKSIKRRLRYFETHPLTTEHGIVKGSMNRFPYTECHFVVSGVRSKSREERENAVNQLVTDLKRNECVFEDMKLDIESFLGKYGGSHHGRADSPEIKIRGWIYGRADRGGVGI